MKKLLLIIPIIFLINQYFLVQKETKFISHVVDLRKTELGIFWKDYNNKALSNVTELRSWFDEQDRDLLFVMNGGMFSSLLKPEGLLIQNRYTLSPINLDRGVGNFYLEPGGIFQINGDQSVKITSLKNFKNDHNIKFATQSGPLLIENYLINPVFNITSNSKYIRNGVGILNDHMVIFILSTKPVSLYEFAEYFKNFNCQSALYLDGFISGVFLPDVQVKPKAPWVTIIAESKIRK